ncbi:MAG: hypothetical protein ACM3OC_09445 [Deltaproteobacteria bacterium]
MEVLKGVLSESKAYYREAEKKISDELVSLCKGSIKERQIRERKYYYLQYRQGKKIIQKYLGKSKSEQLSKQIERRKALKKELKKVKEALKILKRAEGRGRD